MSKLRTLIIGAALIASAITTPAAAQLTSQARMPASYRPEFGTMWTFDAPPLEYWKTRYDFTPGAGWLDNVRLAAIRLPGCSASFVSAAGLVMTNHHCARACISAVSPADTNYQRTGFVAPTVTEEKKCPGLYVDQLTSTTDVTSRVQAKVTATNSARRVEQRDAEIAAIQQECSSGNITCQVVPFYQGGMYSLYKYRRYSDVRLVFAPEEEISFYGGDPDNFTYPRYALDVTLLRVYEGDSPYRPDHFLRWSANGATDGELVFTVGNPGSTGRLNTIAQMQYLRDVQYPGQIATLKRQIAIYHDLSKRSEAIRRQYENTLFGAENSLKAITGYNTGLTSDTIMARKRAFEKDFRSRLAGNPRLSAQYGSAFPAIERAQDSLTRIAIKQRYYGFNASPLTNYAAVIVRMSKQEAMADSLRLTAYRGAALTNLKNQLQSPTVIDTAFERASIAAWLHAARAELGANDAVLVAILAGRTPEATATAFVHGTQLGNAEFRKSFVAAGASAVAASTDPLIVLARRLDTFSQPLAYKAQRMSSVISANVEKVGQAIYAAYGQALPPDATFTLRISDGVVAGFPSNGTIAPFKTSFYGLYARNADFDDKVPFHLPKRWQDHRDALDLSTPLNFSSTNDIIGGNSGSPVINRRGEVVGLIFDSNIESLPNRFIFTDEVARSVSVHSRAIPESIRKVFEAGRLADELEGKR